MKDHQYLIIAGSTKSGSTSLFHYLAAHPQVCASRIKEPRFFLNNEYPLYARFRLEDGLDKYEAYFQACTPSQLRLEASPQYLYSQGTAERIYNNLTRVKLIFILRDPIERLVSYYRFAIQQAYLSSNVDFETYVNKQFKDIEQGQLGAEYMRALAHGRYSTYLERYNAIFPAEDILLLDFKTLTATPHFLIKRVCQFAGIECGFYSDYQFTAFNPTKGSVKSMLLQRIYEKIRRWSSENLYSLPWLWKVLDSFHEKIRPLFLQLNSKPAQPVKISDATCARLRDFYRDEYANLYLLFAS